MKNCAIGGVTTGTYKACIEEATKSIRTLGFALTINIATVHDKELSLVDELLMKWIGCGRIERCMIDMHLNGSDIYTHRAFLKDRAGESHFFENDPDIDKMLEHFHIYDNMISDFVDNIEKNIGDLNKFNQGGSLVP